MNKLLISALTTLLISGCSINPEQYKSNSPSLSFADYFEGKLCAWGTLKGRNKQVTRKFIANIDAFKDQSHVVLDEQFIFSDGEKQTRVWKFIENGDAISGTAGDVVGEATGKIFGDSLHLTYTLDIPQDEGSIEVEMDDWLHLVDRDTLMGTTKMTKWGFDVGQIDIVIQKRNASTDCFAGTVVQQESNQTGDKNASI